MLTCIPKRGVPVTNDNQLLNAALEYAQRGFRIIPLHNPTANGCSCKRPECSSIGKHPRTLNGHKDGTTDELILRDYWSRFPDANVAIVTGAVSGLVVLDVDDKKSPKGSESLAALTAKYGDLQTMEVATGNGRHLYFQHPGMQVPNSVGLLGSGLDVRGEGGYVVAPPSLHANGSRYCLLTDLTPAAMPEWLLSRIVDPNVHESKTEAVSTPLDVAPVIEEGVRNDTLYKLGCSLRGQHAMEETEIANVLLEYNEKKCKPPLPRSEVLAIAAVLLSILQN